MIDRHATPAWPDKLAPSNAQRVQVVLTDFWRALADLPDLLARSEYLLAERITAQLRDLVLEMMLALNGIEPPCATRNLNGYLGPSQRTAIEKTLIVPTVSAESWVGRAVALVVIYRWYAPQLVERFGLTYPQAIEDETWALLRRNIADWPATITSD